VKPIPTPKNVVTHLRVMHDRLNDGWAHVDDAWWTMEAAAIIERLVFQRDEAEGVQGALKAALEEARLEVCECKSQLTGRDFTPMQIAEQRGWPDALAALEETARESYKGGD
jgi:hypothetical protein